jgi:hypothetical protein
VVEVRGISRLLSGKYYVNEAKHVISSSGYVVELKLTRDGTGQRQGTGTGTTGATGQAQGGQPNRTAASTGGALSEVEVVAPHTGSAHVEYRRGGRALGAGDPEATSGNSR